MFDCYIQLLELMIEIEPKLFRTAVRTLKKQMTFKLDFIQMKRLKKLYPDLVPNVFSRLWITERDPKVAMEKHQIFTQAKDAWN